MFSVMQCRLNWIIHYICENHNNTMTIKEKSKCELIQIMKVPNLFVPKSYYTPVSYLKENMPLWIGIDDDKCIVTYLTKNYDQDNQDDIDELAAFALHVISSCKH